MSITPYDTVLEPIEKWCEENYYTDFIVTILIDGAEITQFLEWDAEDGFIWNSDWWEGQEDVKLEGFIPVSHIRIRGIQGFPPVKVQAVNWIPVTERLPDFEGMCLCMRKSYSKANFRHQEIMYFDYDEQAFCSNADGVFVADGNVTHWMPLPKPPEGDEL